MDTEDMILLRDTLEYLVQGTGYTLETIPHYSNEPYALINRIRDRLTDVVIKDIEARGAVAKMIEANKQAFQDEADLERERNTCSATRAAGWGSARTCGFHKGHEGPHSWVVTG
jgi:hypothetical protein